MEKTVNCNTKGNLLTMKNMAIGGPAAFRFEDVPCDRGEYSEKSANFLQDKLMKLEPSIKIKSEFFRQKHKCSCQTLTRCIAYLLYGKNMASQRCCNFVMRLVILTEIVRWF